MQFGNAAKPVVHMLCLAGYSKTTRSAGKASQTLAKFGQDKCVATLRKASNSHVASSAESQ